MPVKNSTVQFKAGVVAFLDALGIKGVWARSAPEDVIEKWHLVLQYFRDSRERMAKRAKAAFTSCQIMAFSDTVIIALEGDTGAADYGNLLPLAAELVVAPFLGALLQGVYFRGVISLGQFLSSDELIVGPAVDEAATWYQYPEWFGISLAPSAYFGLERIIERGADVSRWFISYPVPMKPQVGAAKTGGESKGWALSWPARISRTIAPNDRTITARTIVLSNFAKYPVDNPSAYSKYINTLEFMDFVLKARHPRAVKGRRTGAK